MMKHLLFHFSHILLGSLLLTYSHFCLAQENIEHAQLTAIVRQLDLIQGYVEQTIAQPIESRSRYYFDYQQLHNDISRIKAGIHRYMSPARAQPRDLSDLIGHYQHDRNRGNP